MTAGPPQPDHRALMREAMELEAEGQRQLLAGDLDAGRRAMADAAVSWRSSWEHAPERAFGRLVGMLKAAIIAGGGAEEAAYARREIGDEGDSATSWYALAIAATVEQDDELARRAAEGMRGDSEAFARAADALAALARGDREAYADAVRLIVADFEGRTEHVTGVAIADTALMLESLAERRGMAARPVSKLLPGGRPDAD